MLVKTFGSAVYGVEAIAITIEVNVSNGQGYHIVGLPDNAVKESLQRIEAAIKTNDYAMPRTKIVVNMAPADIRKTGSAFDLSIAIGVLGASEQIENAEVLKAYVIMGELSLDGTVQPIKGALPIAIQTRRDGFKGLIVPKQNAREAAMVAKVIVISANSGGLPEINIHGKTGFLANVGDVKAMSEFAISILTDEKLLQKMKQQAYEQSLLFDISNIVPRYEKLYSRFCRMEPCV